VKAEPGLEEANVGLRWRTFVEGGTLSAALRRFFPHLTPDERLALLAVAALFMLGLIAQTWHAKHQTQQTVRHTVQKGENHE